MFLLSFCGGAVFCALVLRPEATRLCRLHLSEFVSHPVALGWLWRLLGFQERWPVPPAGPEASCPSTGPFISVVLSKLENMLENSLHVNLLLIGIVTQLASYPQPLLRSFLLNTNMVFQPSVRSLYQVPPRPAPFSFICSPAPSVTWYAGCVDCSRQTAKL